MTEAPKDNAIYLHCRNCGHEWPAVRFPLVLDNRGRAVLRSIGSRRCPRCGSDWNQLGRKAA